jgi:hypothetical protein
MRWGFAGNPIELEGTHCNVLQQLLQTMQGPSELLGGGHARLYAAQAVANKVHQMQGEMSELILDGGTTHHVAHSPHLPFSLKFSPTNSVTDPGGELHKICQGGMLL